MIPYYILEWPESQEFMGMPECFTIDGEMSVAVPVSLYNQTNDKNHSHTADIDYKL